MNDDRMALAGSATCAATPPSPRLPSPRRSSISCASIMLAGAARRQVRRHARPVLGRRDYGVLQRPRPPPRPGRARGRDGGGDARGRRQSDRRLAPTRPRIGLRRRHRARLCDLGPDRLRRARVTLRSVRCATSPRGFAARPKDGQILVAQRVAAALDGSVVLEEIGALVLKGLTQPVVAFNVVQGTNATETRPNLTIVARNPRP